MRIAYVVTLIILAGVMSQALGQTRAIDVKAAYRLTNDYIGPDKSLTVHEGSVVIMDNADTPDQLWKFVLDEDGKYRLLNVGEGRAKSLDSQKNGDVLSVFMGDTGDYSGQSWTVTPLGGGKFRLTNTYGGTSRSLDTQKSGKRFEVVMADTGNFSGQAWKLINETPDEPRSEKP